MYTGYLTGDNVTDFEKQFLFLMRVHVNNEKLPDGYRFDVGRVFSLAALHNVTPMVYDSAKDSAEDVFRFKSAVVRSVGHQMMKNAAFRELYKKLSAHDINVIVLKGPICARCYNKPDYRLSSDFDIIVSECDRERLSEFLLKNGFTRKNESYTNNDMGLYLEVSTQLGEGADAIKIPADEAFDGYEDRLMTTEGFTTLGVTDSFVYLIYHAFKHFVGSGFGIRQLVDIMLFTRCHADDIDFDLSCSMLSHIGALTFASNVFFAAEKLFGFSTECFDYKYDEKILCFDDFVNDLLSAGVFGKSSEDRLHSASLVTSAVADKGNQSFIKTVFPPYNVMKSKFPCLRYVPFLLPLFWFFRLVGYVIKVINKKNNVSPAKSIEIAQSRIGLMKKMGIIKQQTD